MKRFLYVAMGRRAYDGGGPIVKKPKKDSTFIRGWSAHQRETLALPKKIVIIQSGAGLHNEHGGQQAEFGYLVRPATQTISLKDANPFHIKRFFRKRKAVKQQKKEIQWTAASILLQFFRPEVENFHRQNRDAPRPYGLDI